MSALPGTSRGSGQGKLLRRVCAILGALAAVTATACSNGGNSDNDRERTERRRPDLALLGHEGRWLTDPSGRVVILHGVSMVAKRPPYLPSSLGFDEEDARFLARQGLRVVRFGVIWKGVEPAPGKYDDRYLDQVESAVDMLSAHGIYTLLDFHQDVLNERFGGEGFPDWAVRAAGGPNRPGKGTEAALQRAQDMFWTNERGPGGVPLQDRYAAAVRHVAARFAERDSVIGYDIFNEPYGGFRFKTCSMNLLRPREPSGGFRCREFERELGAFNERVTKAIRAVDQKHLAWYEPHVLFNWAAPTTLPDIRGPRLGMSFHAYCPPPEFGRTCEKSVRLVMANAERRAAETGDAVMVTEFGNPSGKVLGDIADAADAPCCRR